MKTYKSFIFKKRDETPKILKFSEDIKNFVQLAIERKEDWIVDLKDNKSKFDTTLSVVVISIDVYYANLDFIRIFYNKDQDYIYFDLHTQYNDTVTTLKQLLDFFGDLLKQYLIFADIHRYKIKISELDNVMKEISLENLDFNSTAKNYNL
jgi:hypothetical protein